MVSDTERSTRSAATRDRILVAAERLFAEHGLFAVSNRQVSEAAGQGNNAAVGYHFGTKTDLVRAIVTKHAGQIEELRAAALHEIEGSTDVRDWVTCLVRPSTEHLAALGTPSWYARFNAQVLTDPTLRVLVYTEASGASPSLAKLVSGLGKTLDDLPEGIRRARADMGRSLMVHMCAERELRLAGEGDPDPIGWHDFGTDLIDAIVGIWTAPVTR
ncbi:TetR/AcrR family transcriptional regulator [Williamsia sp. 1135]|uniref:TetR/AcrR family transcriptional regulator n=1 Tax=Williamsia sp. 1135 TaxID=1889262 RepID=UPI000A106285|nr:TetR/AcrR family transcriptional regulator [Williamsia sp. 1135]ORM34541.1 TetR family transcriptional regulator [Williamsia sp. 1135]